MPLTRIDFYILGDTGPQARERAACRLAEKAWLKNHRVYVHTSSTEAARAMDELMWTFRQNSFVPHAIVPAAPDDPVTVLVGVGHPPEHESDVLLNLTEKVPEFFTQFDRIAEFVDGTEHARASGRERYRQYRDHGCAIESHNV